MRRARSVLATLAGVGLGLGLAVLLPQGGCSCPPGYKARPIRVGTYSLSRVGTDLGADQAFGQLVVTDTTATHTFEAEGAQYQVTYTIAGAR
jgi:hypothetical protein